MFFGFGDLVKIYDLVFLCFFFSRRGDFYISRKNVFLGDILENEDIRKVLEDSNNIAVVGASRNETKDAYKIPKFLQEKGYKIIPVNPYAEEILGEKAYSSLSEVEEEIDIVDVFRPSEEAYGIVEEALDTDADVVWLQLGIKDDDAEELGKENGLKVIQDKCIKIEYGRLM